VTDAWYPLAADYWVDSAEASAYPPRQGDLFGAIDTPYGHWDACQLYHPTCELVKAAVTEVQVLRVHKLAEIDVSQHGALAAGFQEKDGAIQVAHTNTYFLAPLPFTDTPMFSNFREVALVSKADLMDRRTAAMTHDARVSFIRRSLYFRYRVMVGMADVKGWETTRISNDPHFAGPRPDWAPPASTS
jgi:hypothetical protein